MVDTPPPPVTAESQEAPPPSPRRRSFRFAIFYRIGGAVLAVCGALFARLFAAAVPPEQRILFWIAGTVFIFTGLYLICVPTRRRHRAEQEAEEAASPEDQTPPEGMPKAANDP